MPLERWQVDGRLTTTSPLRLGSGEPTRRDALRDPESGASVEIAAVALDHLGRAYLPASALKGVLRRRLRRLGLDPELLRELFGHEPGEEDEERQRGGIVEFRDAFADRESTLEALPPYWDPGRLTGVTARVAIDRRSGAASEQRLFHLEYVPAGCAFELSLGGSFDEEGAAALLAALEGFNDTDDPVTLGAEGVAGWGRMRWVRGEVRKLGQDGVQEWLRDGAPASTEERLEALEDDALASLLEQAVEVGRGAPCLPSAVLDLELAFDGPFLVNDPAQTGPGENEPDHAPLLDSAGRAYLPSASFRGALRSQAERILRTVAGDAGACGSGSSRPSCRLPASVRDLRRLCPACKLFGGAGWRSPVEISDFTAADDLGPSRRQEFLAIDRFDGGGAVEWRGPENGSSGLKFNADFVWRPVLTGRLRLDLEALARAGIGTWALALVALVLRDLAEGDVTFGWGASKGYGACTGRLTALQLPPWAELPESLRKELERLGLETLPSIEKPPAPLPQRDSAVGVALARALDELAGLRPGDAGGQAQ
jgi:CRISPR/Cas system CSM-associated protein Csm3 (group 7 of RAMP superfamily)